MRITFLAAAAAIAFTAQAASAQSVTTQFRGLRLEGNAGWDHFQSQGTNNDKFGYGGTVGFDGTVNDRIVIGAEGSYWRPGGGNENCTGGVNGGSICHKSFEEWGVAARAGYLVTPDLLVFGKGGYVVNEQRKRFDPAAGTGETAFYNHDHTTGYQVGGGVEYTLSQVHLPVPVYVNAQYVYSNYSDHTSRQRVMGGIGIRFK